MVHESVRMHMHMRRGVYDNVRTFVCMQMSGHSECKLA